MYIYQDGDVNAFLVKRFRTRMILLPHGLLEETLKPKNQAELTWVIARSIGHLKAKHVRLSWLNLLVESFEKLFVLNLFLLPWERATQYTGDRIGLSVSADLPRAIRALNRLMIGNPLVDQVTLEAILNQRRRTQGSFFAWLAECLSTHPPITSRTVSLIEWAKTVKEDWYEELISKEKDRERIEGLLQNN